MSEKLSKKKIHKDDFDGNLIYGGEFFHTATNREVVLEDLRTGAWGNKFFTQSGSSRNPKRSSSKN